MQRSEQRERERERYKEATTIISPNLVRIWQQPRGQLPKHNAQRIHIAGRAVLALPYEQLGRRPKRLIAEGRVRGNSLLGFLQPKIGQFCHALPWGIITELKEKKANNTSHRKLC